MWIKRLWVCLVVSLLLPGGLAAQGTGQIVGRVLGKAGSGLGGVTVKLDQTSATRVTDGSGNFAFDGVPEGTYSLTLTLGDQTATQGDVQVTAGRTTRVEKQVDWELTFAETIVVYSASRRTERIVDAPAAVTVITEEEIERKAASGQIPKLLEFTPGAELTQSGLYDFNFNVRGFNSSLNRRVQTLIDGRDPSVPFLGSQEWSSISYPTDELASVELVRGPGSALYGADAFNGVLNMTTKAPRFSQGGKIRLTGGELSTRRLDLRYATELGGDWYFKVVGGYLESDDFYRPRNVRPEYSRFCTAPGQFNCLPREPIPLVLIEDKIGFGGIRFDKYFRNESVFTLEGGTATIEGPVAVTGIGRVQLTDVERPWVRTNFNTRHWNVMAYFNERDADDQRSLSSGASLFLDSERFHIEVQGNTGFGGGRGRIVGGVSYMEEDIDSANLQGRQTLMFRPRNEDFTGVFGQIEWDFTDKFKGVFAARWDDSSLHDSQVSPRASLVYAFNPNHTLRVSYNEAFQVPNYSEFFLQVPVAAPANLSPFEAICALGGVSCGFGQPVPILAVGNPTLEVEEIQSFEVGYNGILGRKAYLTIDVYRNEIENFITDLIGRFNRQLGNINPTFGPYTPPAELPPPLQAVLLNALQNALGPTFFILTNNFDGSPILAALSYVNFGEVETEGVEIGLNYYVTDRWQVDFSYTFFDFEVQQQLQEDPVLPNTAENRFSVGFSYTGSRFDAALKYRYVEDFEWNAGIFRGRIPSYDVVDLAANYRINDKWSVGVDVSNLLDDEHFEIFGGDLLERRALGYIAFSWR